MTVIAILNPKGGSGKTTLATNLARALYNREQRVLLVDTDPQGSARDWHAVTDNNPLDLVGLDRPNNLKTVDNMEGAYDYLIIDGAAKLESMLAATIKVSDLILIPVQPSPYDIWATGDLVEVVRARQEIMEGKPKAGFIITRKISGTRLGSDVRAALDEYELPVLEAETVQRQVYPRSAAAGSTVFDENDAKAREEIERMVDEIMHMLEKG